MASIYKRKQDKGKRRACWYIGYIDHDDRRRTIKGFSDRAETERLASRLEEESRLIRTGLVSRKAVSLAKSKLRPISAHVSDFEAHLRTRDITEKQVRETISRLKRFVAVSDFDKLDDLTRECVEKFLAGLRADGRSKQTSNHYLKAIKQFTGWLVSSGRYEVNPLSGIKRLNVETDRRHQRRALTVEEFRLLVEAAENGPVVESIEGTTRAMMYVLSAWTGCRKGEIGSLTMRSFDFEAEHSTVAVEAAFSKRKRRDVQVLHPEVTKRLVNWLEAKNIKDRDQLLFPVSGSVPGGIERKTHKMMRCDLEAAREQWIQCATSESECEERNRSDFLCYRNSVGQFADFHANRHTFITNLAKAGVSPKAAQELARHSDIRLTMGIYTHTDMAEKAASIQRLPSPSGENSVPQPEGKPTGCCGQARERWECSGSAPESQDGTEGHSVALQGEYGFGKHESSSSAEVVGRTRLDAACPTMAREDGNIPERIRTSNLRLRRPTLYPIELRGLGGFLISCTTFRRNLALQLDR